MDGEEKLDGAPTLFPTRNFADLSDGEYNKLSSFSRFSFAEIPKNEYNNKNQSTGNSPIKVELQNNMDR